MGNTPQPVDSTVVSARSTVVRAARSPLGFFVLALLIVEGFLVGAGVWFGLSESWRLVALGVGVVMFLLVFGMVFWLVIRYPQNLVFSEESHVQVAALRIYGNESHRISVDDIIAIRSQPPPEPPTGQLPPPNTRNG
jgi:heme A synthase